jgi:sporulation protein YlmC with PRC-barrel domain
MEISYEHGIRGRTVIDAAGRAIGTVEDLLVANDGWNLQALRVKLDHAVAKDLGQRRRAFHAAVLDIPMARVLAAGDAIVLSVPVDALVSQPEEGVEAPA